MSKRILDSILHEMGNWTLPIVALTATGLGIYGIIRATRKLDIFKIADKFLMGGDYITFAVIQNPGSRSVKHIRIGFGGISAGGTLHAIEIKRGGTKDFGKHYGTLIKVDVARNFSTSEAGFPRKTLEYSGWMSRDDWAKIKPYLEPITNLQYLFVD